MEFLEFIPLVIRAFFGAFVSVLYAPKSPTWARWQRIGVTLGAAAILSYVAGFAAVWRSGWSFPASFSVFLGHFLLAAYLFVGYICYAFHTDAKFNLRFTLRSLLALALWVAILFGVAVSILRWNGN